MIAFISLVYAICHIFSKNRISAGRIGYKYMSYRTYYLVVLDYGTAAHALNYTAGDFNKPFVGYADHHISGAVLGSVVYLFNVDGVVLRFVAVYRRPYLRFACGDVLSVAKFEFPAFCRYFGK